MSRVGNVEERGRVEKSRICCVSWGRGVLSSGDVMYRLFLLVGWGLGVGEVAREIRHRTTTSRMRQPGQRAAFGHRSGGICAVE